MRACDTPQRHWSWYWPMLLALVACESATTTREPDDVDYCAAENLLRKECGLAARECEIPVARCQAKCFAGWGCAELADPSSDPGIQACWLSCGVTLECEDGQDIHDSFRCDGIADCLNGEDEQGCVLGRPSRDAGGETADAGAAWESGDASADAASPDAARAGETSADAASPDAARAGETSADAATDGVATTGGTSTNGGR